MSVFKKIGCALTSFGILAYQNTFAATQQEVYGPTNMKLVTLESKIGTVSQFGNNFMQFIRVFCMLSLPIMLLVGMIVYAKQNKDKKKKYMTVLLAVAFVLACIMSILLLRQYVFVI